MDKLPYKEAPYKSRNWGHPWHSLCSYHGKLKPAIAHMLVREFTNTGETVVDPLCGVGTIPFEACLQGRIGIGNDLSPMAYIVTKAKLEHPNLNEVNAVLEKLNKYIAYYKDTYSGEEYNDFGFNDHVPSYFENETYKEILSARKFFVDKKMLYTPAEAMVFSAFLHVLHGNRPYALSRCSHPLTPYAPKGAFEYKSVIKKISQKIVSTYKAEGFENLQSGTAIYGDYMELSKKQILADWIICSPPFVDSIRFYMQNWMRFWLCGWEKDNFKQADNIFIDKKQKNDFNIYFSFFEMCSKILKDRGRIILHLGKTSSVNMGLELASRANRWFEMVYLASEDVRTIEKHGIKDKGGIIAHQFLFLQKK